MKEAEWSASDPFSYKKQLCDSKMSDFSINKLKFSTLDLYGREQEIAQLFGALDRLRDPENNRKEVVLISGPSGAGKSKLAEELLVPKKGRIRSIYVTGKFDLQQKNEPYSAFGSACRSICDHLISHTQKGVGSCESQNVFNQILENVRTQLGSEARALFPLIPRLKELLRRKNSIVHSEKTNFNQSISNFDFLDTKNQFFLALRRFMRAVGSVVPISMVLDDIQWADQASLDAINSLLTDRDNPWLMIVATYRSGSETNSHQGVRKLLKQLVELEIQNGISVTNIAVGNLRVPDVNDMIVDLLSTDQNDASTKDLAKLVHRKTAGNAFFVEVFLNSLASKELLLYNFGLSKWIWNAADIEEQTRVSENVVDVLTEKMKHIPTRIRHGLLLAACLGSAFDRNVLVLMMRSLTLDNEDLTFSATEASTGHVSSLVSAEEWLVFCENKGLIENCGDNLFRWVHDKVQESALRLASPETVSSIKLQVGRLLALESSTSTILEDNLFVAVNHLNEKTEEFTVKDTRDLKIIELNLRAGRKAIEASAFDAAAEYLRHGISFLTDNSWETRYELTLQIHTLAAKAEYSCGDISNMRYHCEVIISNAQCLRDSFPVYPLLIDAAGNHHGPQEAVDIAVDILSKLGCNFPKHFRSLRLGLAFLRLRATTKSLQLKDLMTLQPMTDEYRIETMAILVKMSAWAMLAKSDLELFATSKSFHLTLQYGLDKNAPAAIATVGMILGVGLGDTASSRRYALQSLQLADQSDPRTVMFSYGVMLPWTQSIASCLHPILDAYKRSIEQGDLVSGTWCMYMYLQMSIQSGRNLDEVDAGFREHVWKMKESEQMKPYNFGQIAWQSVLNLMGKSPDPFVLTGEAMDEQNFVGELDDTQDQEMFAIINYQHLFLACMFGNHRKASNIAMNVADELPMYLLESTRQQFLTALSCASMARSTGRRKYKREARRQSRKIKGWVKKNNPNVIHFDLLVDAELAALDGNHNVARKKYQQAIRLAARSGFIHDQALANERYAEFLLEYNSDRSEASYRMTDAIRLYAEWGAAGKVEQLNFVHAGKYLILDSQDLLKHDAAENTIASSEQSGFANPSIKKKNRISLYHVRTPNSSRK